MKHLQGIFGIDVSGLRERHQDIVIEGACLGPEPAGNFSKDHTGADQSFGVVVVGGDPVGEVQECEKLMLLFEQSFAQAPDVRVWSSELNKSEKLALKAY